MTVLGRLTLVKTVHSLKALAPILVTLLGAVKVTLVMVFLIKALSPILVTGFPSNVEGITTEHIQKWGWRITEQGWVNFPDNQLRIYKNNPEIKWENKVHEILEGYKTVSHLPFQEEWCLYHPKTIERQEKQNNIYSKL